MKIPDGALHLAGTRHERPTRDVVDPWTNATLGSVAQADEELATVALDAASAAFARTRRMPSHSRRDLCAAVARGITAARADLTELIVHEAGKPRTLAAAEVDRAVMTFTVAAEESTRIGGEIVPLDLSSATDGLRGEVHRVPRGPVLAITPFNFPLNLVAHKVAPAFACGAPVVLKPAPKTPFTALRLAEIVRAVGGGDMLQVVPCDNDVAEHLVRSDAFAVLSFTGSDEVGWHLRAIAGKKHVVLELGGNAACIVHEDAGPLADIASKVAASAFAYAGQVCIKTQRLVVASSIADRFTSALEGWLAAHPLGDPEDEATVYGPMIDELAAKRLEAWILEARHAGARVLGGGPRIGNRLPASLVRIDGDGRGLRVVEEEAFGPVLTIQTFDHDAVALAGRTRYGLQAGIFTDRLANVDAAFVGLDVGGLVVNDVPTLRVDAMPYGGVRDSGIGREGVRYAIEEMTDRKLLVRRAPSR